MVTDTFPDAPDPTTAVIPVAESTVKDFAAVPPKLTAVAPVKFAPFIFTIVPLVPVKGLKEVMAVGVIYVNPISVAVPFGVLTARLPVAPDPTTAKILPESC